MSHVGNLPKVKFQKHGGGSKKGRQVVAHRAKHARYQMKDLMNKNKVKRKETQNRREAKQASKKKEFSMSQDKKLVEVVKDDEPGKEIETPYDKLLKGPMSERMKPMVKGEECCYGGGCC